MKILKEFKDDPYDFLENAKISDITKLINYASEAYYNSNSPIMNDNQYDLLVDELKKRNPNHSVLKKIGARIHSKKKVNLPFHMGSMDKIKPDTGMLDKWINKFSGPYLLSDKLDGASGLLILPDNKLYTRGNGTVGTDISSIIPYINGIPKYILKKQIVVRGELLLSKKRFKNMSKTRTDPRSTANGLINKKSATKEELSNIDFIAYEIVSPFYNIGMQYSMLKKLKFHTVTHAKIANISEKQLSEYLKSRKQKGLYEVDGIVVTDNNKHPRNLNGNPKYAFAFKDILEEQMGTSTITQIEWRESKDSKLKPRVHIKPIKIGGITIKHITGNNAKYIKSNGLGKGAIVKIIRSGDVIPKIQEVIKKVTPDFPDIPYKWNNNKVEILVNKLNSSDESKQNILVKNIAYFLKKTQVKYIDESLVRKLVNANLDSVHKILSASINDLMTVDGFQERMAYKIHTNIKNSLTNVKLSTIMAASNLFGSGLGEKKIDLIVKNHPDILDKKITKTQLIDLICKIDGFSTTTSTAFAESLPEFKKFLKKLPDIKFAKQTKIKKDSKFDGVRFVFSGFRNKEWTELVEAKGGKLHNTVSKNTNYLVVVNKNGTSSKITKAKQLNVKVIDQEEFKSKFL
jgi:NAD-dependent DNA ligase